MEKGENFRRKSRPTMQQLQYLIELEKVDKKRGIIAQIAENCGVNHASVSRYLKTCCENEILTKKYEFTEAGKAWFTSYKKLMAELAVYLRSIGIPENEIEENIKDMIENVGHHTLVSILGNVRKTRSTHTLEKKEMFSNNFLKEVLPSKIECAVYFMIYQLEGKRGISVSMADQGFEKPAILRQNRRGSWLQLTIRDMSAHSRVNGEKMTGHLETLKYEQRGMLIQAEIKNGVVRIPLGACSFHRRKNGEIKGMIPVAMTCSVGRTHMPESTALLVFWI